MYKVCVTWVVSKRIPIRVKTVWLNKLPWLTEEFSCQVCNLFQNPLTLTLTQALSCCYDQAWFLLQVQLLQDRDHFHFDRTVQEKMKYYLHLIKASLSFKFLLNSCSSESSVEIFLGRPKKMFIYSSNFLRIHNFIIVQKRMICESIIRLQKSVWGLGDPN